MLLWPDRGSNFSLLFIFLTESVDGDLWWHATQVPQCQACQIFVSLVPSLRHSSALWSFWSPSVSKDVWYVLWVCWTIFDLCRREIVAIMIDSTIGIYVSFAEGHQHEEILDPRGWLYSCSNGQHWWYYVLFKIASSAMTYIDRENSSFSHGLAMMLT